MFSISQTNKFIHFSLTDTFLDNDKFILFLDQITNDEKYAELFTYKLVHLTCNKLFSLNVTNYSIQYEFDKFIQKQKNTIGIFSSFTTQFVSDYAESHDLVLKDNILYYRYIPVKLLLKVLPINVYGNNTLIVNDNNLTNDTLDSYYKNNIYKMKNIKEPGFIFDKFNLQKYNDCLSEYIYIPSKHNKEIISNVLL